MINSYALHKIADENIVSFSPHNYSRFKFGDDAVAKEFGINLALGFINNHVAKYPFKQQIVVIPSPYSYIPTATFAMKNHFVGMLDKWLLEHNKPTTQEAKVSRSITYKEDYGALSAEERIKLIGNDTFHIDKALLEGKMLVFLDDIKITGSHERMILKMIKEYNIENEIHLLYFAELVNKQIDPSIENYLNYYSVKSIFDIGNIVKSGNFKFNTRVVKYILHTDLESFVIFMQNQTDEFWVELYNLAMGNGYDTIDAYAANLNHIKNQLSTNKFKIISHGN
jgi:hypothetical protein